MINLDDFLDSDVVAVDWWEKITGNMSSTGLDWTGWVNTSSGYYPFEPDIDPDICVRCGVEIDHPTNLCETCLEEK